MLSLRLRTQGLQVRILPGAPLTVFEKASSHVLEAFIFQSRFTMLPAYLGLMLQVNYLAGSTAGLISYSLSGLTYPSRFARNTGITLSVRS